MRIYHPEEEIKEKLPDGRILVTYKDAYTEEIEDMICPFCKNNLKFYKGRHEVAKGFFTESYKILCDFGCHFEFYGIQEEYAFKDRYDFANFVRGKLKSI